MPLGNALLTADPSHNKEPTLRVIVEKGGDYLIGTKCNTSNRFEAVEKGLGNSWRQAEPVDPVKGCPG